MAHEQTPTDWSLTQKVLAWSVHLFTALGLVCSALITVCIIKGTEQQDGHLIRWVFLLMLIATSIDAIDGTFARLVRIKEVIPGFDGRRLDDLIDFLNFTFLPILLIWRLNILPDNQELWLLFPLLASVYGFCQVNAKTPDGYFLGFPSYWNIVAFYLYALQPLSPLIALMLIIVPSIFTFVPTRYLYPTQRGTLNMITNGLGIIWMALVLWTIFLLPNEILSLSTPTGSLRRTIALISLAYPIFYLSASFIVDWRIRRSQRKLSKRNG